MASFGELLKGFRNKKGLSQRSFAQKVGVDTSYISRIESGEREVPSRSLALKFAEILKLSNPEIEVWLMSAGYISPRLQQLADNRDSRLLEIISFLDDESLSE